MSETVGSVLILVGAAFGALSGFGQVRFSDLMTRMHVATKPGTHGLLLVAVGAMFHLKGAGAVTLLVLTIVLQFATAPVSAHLVGRAAHRHGQIGFGAGTSYGPSSRISGGLGSGNLLKQGNTGIFW